MFLIKFVGIETLVIESEVFIGLKGWSRSRARGEGGRGGSSSSLEMERTASGSGILGSGIRVPLLSSGCEIIGHASGCFGG